MSITSAAKRRKLSPSENKSDSQAHDDFYKRAAGWDLEQDYEQRPRKQKKKEKESSRLPIKTAEGRLEQSRLPETISDDGESWLELDEEPAQQASETLQAQKEVVVSTRQQIIDAKEDLARIASMINENPEENASGFRSLGVIASTKNPTIKNLALATQMAVYKDVIPGYRIRPLSQGDREEKVSKDIRHLRSFEQSLIHSYQIYLKDLATCAKRGLGDNPEAKAGVRAVAISCACALILAVPHFNFRGELLKILVGQLSGRSLNSANFVKCHDTLIELFQSDDDGVASLDAVSLLTKMIKARNFQVDESVLSLFLHLRLLAEFSSKASQNRIDKNDPDDQSHRKKLKAKREFRTKKQRKLLKEQKAVEKDFKEADAVVSHEERDKMQAETLKMVFVTYFRILKARTPHLMGAVLEGLAKYAHLINQDFFGDLLEALKDLIRDTDRASLDARDQEDILEDTTENHHDTQATDIHISSQQLRNPPDTTRETLLCITTAFALLEGQDAARSATALNLDLTFFTQHLYKLLPTLAVHPDLELSSKTPRLPDPDDTTTTTTTSSTSSNPPTSSSSTTPPTASSAAKINIHHPSALLLRSLASALTPRSTPPTQLAAFTKHLHTSSLHFPEKTTRGAVALLTALAKHQGAKIGSLWRSEERKGDGVWDPYLAVGGDVGGMGMGMVGHGKGEARWGNPFASTVWEGELLRLHYAPEVREGVRGLEKVVGRIGA